MNNRKQKYFKLSYPKETALVQCFNYPIKLHLKGHNSDELRCQSEFKILPSKTSTFPVCTSCCLSKAVF